MPSAGIGAAANQVGGDYVSASEGYAVELGVAAYEVDLFGRVRSLSEAALQQFLATAEARRSAQLALVAEVANAYLALASDQELQQVAQATVASHAAAYELAAERRRLGAVSSLDVAQALTALESARADEARLAGQVAQDINALSVLVGGRVEPDLLPDAFVPDVSGLQPLPAGVPSTVLLRRPDVRQAERLLLAANASIGAARAAYFPSITLTAAAGTASRDLSGLFDSGTFGWSFMPQVNLPIFQGGRLRANEALAEAERDIALAQYEKAVQSGFREVADALAPQRPAQRQRVAQEGLLAAAIEAHRLSEVRYRGGRDSYLALLDAQRTLYAARQAVVTTQRAEQVNRVTLYKVLGGGWLETSGAEVSGAEVSAAKVSAAEVSAAEEPS